MMGMNPLWDILKFRCQMITLTPAPLKIQSKTVVQLQTMSILVVNQSVIDMCASLFSIIFCRGKKDDRHVAGQHLRPVYVSLLATEKAAVVYAGDVNLRNCHHDFEPLHRRHLSD